ncbi:MAG: acyltransferase [Pseudomonadota bacterium]
MGLQIGRGIAALLVVFHHITLGSSTFYGDELFNGFFEFGFIGVDFFFVLSGFIIYWVHSNDQQNISSGLIYLKKRLIRIYPPFILISIVLLLAYSLFPTLSTNSRDIGVITSLLLIPTPPLEPALTVSWTLMHEMLFYLIFISIFYNKKLFNMILFIWAISIITVAFSSMGGVVRTFILNPHNLEFMFGIISAVVIKNKKGKGYFLPLGLILFTTYIYSYQHGYHSNINQLFIKIYLGTTFMFTVIGLCNIDHKVKYPKFLIFIGAASYSIYLIHNPVISILNRIASKGLTYVEISPSIIFILVSAFSILSGIVYYLVWEKPMLKLLKNKFL